MALKFLKKPSELNAKADKGVKDTLSILLKTHNFPLKDKVFVASLATTPQFSVKQRGYAGALVFQHVHRLMPNPTTAITRMKDLPALVTETGLKQLYYESSVTKTGMLLQCANSTFKLSTNHGALLTHAGGWKIYPGLPDWESKKAEAWAPLHFALIMEAVEFFFEPVQFIARNPICPVSAKYGRTPEKAAFLMKLGMVLSKYSGKGVHP